MPYQIKNGIIYSGNAVTLTQAQYDALTTAEKNNGTVYYIYDSDAMIEAQEVGLDGGNVETLAGSVATFENSPSTAVHAEGEYILYQAQLYKVTSAIAVGEDLTVGSNIEATNLGNELNAGLLHMLFGSWVTGNFSANETKSTQITFDSPMANTNYSVSAILTALTGGVGWDAVRLRIANKTVNGFTLNAYNSNGSSLNSATIEWTVIY